MQLTRTNIISYVYELVTGHCFKLPLSIINYGTCISKQYAGSKVSDHCPLRYLSIRLHAELGSVALDWLFLELWHMPWSSTPCVGVFFYLIW